MFLKEPKIGGKYFRDCGSDNEKHSTLPLTYCQ